jgi:hypothetical protein
MTTFRRIGIDPIGSGETEGAFTAHIEVRLPTDSEPVMEETTPVRKLLFIEAVGMH